MEILTRYVPAVIVQGDTVTWTSRNITYPSTDGWTLTYTLQITGTAHTVVAVGNSDGSYTATIPSTVSATYAGGNYRFQGVVTSGSDRHTVEQGTLFVELDFATNPDANSESEVKRALDAVEANLLGKATSDQQSYTIQGRSLTRYSIEELQSLRDYYQRRYDRELAEEGLKVKKTIQVSFLGNQ